MRWIKWSIGEGVLRTISILFSKMIGESSLGPPHLTGSILVIGCMQTVVASGVLFHKKLSFAESRQFVFGSILFGAGAFVNSFLAFWALGMGAPIAVYTLLTLLSIVPGALIDRLWFGQTLAVRHVVGIVSALVAGWLVLKTPDIREIGTLPNWVWIGLANALGVAMNQGVSLWIKEISPWVKNFWGGLSTAACGLLAIVLMTGSDRAIILNETFAPVLLWSVGISVVVVGVWTYNVIAYRDGAAIAAKHVVVNGLFLTLATGVGIFFYGDTFTTVQAMGMGLYVAAFMLLDNEVWTWLRATVSQHFGGG